MNYLAPFGLGFVSHDYLKSRAIFLSDNLTRNGINCFLSQTVLAIIFNILLSNTLLLSSNNFPIVRTWKLWITESNTLINSVHQVFIQNSYIYNHHSCQWPFYASILCNVSQGLSPFWVQTVWYHIYIFIFGIIHVQFRPKTGLAPV